MSLTKSQKDQLLLLREHMEDISKSVFRIGEILKEHFPKEYESAYQHWIPQIVTGLYDHDKWLPRGQLTMKDTLDRIVDKANDSAAKGVTKYIN
jgi:hypothetical protein